VFIDDNPAERHRVREARPEVLVPDWPEDPMLFRQALDGLDVFNTPHFSQEDAHRTELYASERKRGEIRQLAASMDEWLRSLEITVAVQELGAQNRLRATQLFNKTNQMNLSTRRMGEMELAAWSSLPGNHLWVFRVSDRHGDSGLTGISSLSLNGKRAQVVDFILSCRVMGRRVEETMVHWLVVQARKLGAAEVMAEYLPTEKNRPCREFWERSGFSRNGENTFIWDASRPYPLPEFISLPPI
jgi:FkbH-like protein